MMKPPIILKRVIMQANHLNTILANENTPKTAIEYESIELSKSLEEYRNSGRKVNPADVGVAIEVLKKARKRIDELEKETDNE